MIRHIRGLASALVLGVAGPAPSLHAQGTDWPTRPVHIIVPAPAGGAYDRTIRPLAQELANELKQPFVIDNRPGAGNIIGTQAGATAAPNGYAVTMTGMINTIAPGLYEHVPFDIRGDFEHVASIGGGAQWLVVNARSGIDSFAELLARARREPGRLVYASSGQGSTGHLLMELLQRATGTTLTHVPYKGGAPALQDVLGGQVPVTIVPASGTLQYVRNGRLKVLAVSSPARDKDLPQVPTFAELGYPQLGVSSWVGLSVPKGTPRAIVDKLNAAVRTALAKPDLAAKLEAEGIVPMATSPEAYARLVDTDTERWGRLTRSLKIKAE